MNYKFRAWDKVNKKMINNISWKTLQANLFVNTSHGFAAQYDPQYEWLDVDLMLFTGLYDKNQVEVYEGDIISYGKKEHKYNNILVEYKTNVKPSDEECYTYTAGFNISLLHNKEFKVIGNIYQNPDLIKTLRPKQEIITPKEIKLTEERLQQQEKVAELTEILRKEELLNNKE